MSKLYGIVYNPCNNNTKIYNEENITSSLLKTKGISTRIRIYNVNILEIVLSVIKKYSLNVKIFVGLWTELYPRPDNEGDDLSKDGRITQLDTLEDILARYGTGNIESISLTNEGFLRASQANLSQAMRDAAIEKMKMLVDLTRTKISRISSYIPPIGICEAPTFFLDRYNNSFNIHAYILLMKRLDFVGINVHPIYTYGVVSPTIAYTWTNNMYLEVKQRLNTYLPNIKDIIVSEVGMPTSGIIYGNAFQTRIAKDYMNLIVTNFSKNNVKYYWFSLFDNSAKSSEFERKWGIYEMNYNISRNQYDMPLKYSV